MATVALLEADPDLGVGLTPEETELATRALVAHVVGVPAGPWEPSALRSVGDALLGALVLDGRLQRSVRVGPRGALHLFGVGDVIRPWDDDDLGMIGDTACSWAALEGIQLALLDRRFVTTASRWPSVLIEIARRIAGQASRIQLQSAFGQMTRVDDRVLLLFWRLGQRWGRMTPDGVTIPISLTHARVAELVGARRPPVSTALGRLSRDGLLWRTDDGWLLARSAEDVIARSLAPGDERRRGAGGGSSRPAA